MSLLSPPTSSSNATTFNKPQRSLDQLMFLVTTRKEGGSTGTANTSNALMVGVDDHEGSLSIAHNIAFKSCIADTPNTLTTLITGSRSHYSGRSSYSSGDYIAVAQSLKPLINIYQWGKPQPLYHIATQEILSSLVTDPSGEFLFGGSRKGYIYAWSVLSGELLVVWQAHFQSVNVMRVSDDGQFLVSGSDDGSIKVWTIAQLLDNTLITASSLKQMTSNQRTIAPYRHWPAHTLPITDMVLIDSYSVFRVASCSLDRTVHIFDIHANKSITKHILVQPVQSISINSTFDYIFCGSTVGNVYRIDISVMAAGFSVPKAHIVATGSGSGAGAITMAAGLTTIQNLSKDKSDTVHGIVEIDAHSQSVTGIVNMPDNERVLTVSEDGKMKMWNMYTCQLLKEIAPLSKNPITNCKLMLRPENLDMNVNKPTICNIPPMRKYMDNADQSSSKLSKIVLQNILMTEESRALGFDSIPQWPVFMGGLNNADVRKGFGKDSHVDTADEDVLSEPDVEGKIESRKDKDDDLEFVPFGENILQVASESDDEEDTDNSEALPLPKAEIIKKLNQLEKLEADNRKWRALYEQMDQRYKSLQAKQNIVTDVNVTKSNDDVKHSEDMDKALKKKAKKSDVYPDQDMDNDYQDEDTEVMKPKKKKAKKAKRVISVDEQQERQIQLNEEKKSKVDAMKKKLLMLKNLKGSV